VKDLIIKNISVVNQGEITVTSLKIKDGVIVEINPNLGEYQDPETKTLNGEGLHLLPGLIDDQVHFREPGLTHKGNIRSESRAAVAGGITSFMEMPNTNPQALDQDLLEQKYQIGKKDSSANYSFFMGASNNNIEEVLKTNPKNVCGVKIFMGSSTGNMLVDDEKVLNGIFEKCKMLIAVHCEDEKTIRENIADAKNTFGANIPISEHWKIRSHKACYLSSSKAVKLAKKHDARLHVLHISTADEITLFSNELPLEEKKITAEACIHHMWFDDADYDKKGTHIKWNPAVKNKKDQDAIRQAVKDNYIDVIATDHAPHTLEEKSNGYLDAPSGGPLVQHALPALLEMFHQGVFTLEEIVEKTSHSPAKLFQIKDRGYIDVGKKADMVLVDLNRPWMVNKDNILYHCGWSPFEGQEFRSKVVHTFVNGHHVYNDGVIDDSIRGERLLFDRK
jgi:dihydroorotase